MKKNLTIILAVALAFFVGSQWNLSSRSLQIDQSVQTPSVEGMQKISAKCGCSLSVPTDWIQIDDQAPLYDEFLPAAGTIELDMGQTLFTIGYDHRDRELIRTVYDQVKKDDPNVVESALLIGGEQAVRFDYFAEDNKTVWRSEFYIFPQNQGAVYIATDFPELSDVQAVLISLRF